jgi:hypothetical protein
MGKKPRKDGDKALLEMDADLAELYESVEGCKFELNLERATEASPLGGKSSKTSPIGKKLRKDGDKALLEMDAVLAELYESVGRCTPLRRWKRPGSWRLCSQVAADAEHHLWTATGDMCIPHCTPFGRWKRSGCWGWYIRLAADDVHDMRSFPNGLLYCRRSSGHWHSNRPYGVHFKNGRGRQSRGLAPFLIPARRPGENGRPYDQAVRIRRTCEQVDGRFGDCLGSGRYACKNRDVGTWLAW